MADENKKQCTVIVSYEVAHEDADRFLDSWEKANDFLRQQPGFVSTANSASGSLSTFTSRTILPVSSTMQTLVSLTETSSPAKCSMLRFSF